MTYLLADGTRVEYRESSAVNGPDQTSGLHYGTSYLYYRVNGGPWEKSNQRSLHRAALWVECCESITDFREDP